jgi:xylulokinase
VLGIDLGTGALKAALVDRETGEIVALAAVEHTTHYPEPGAAEQTPDDWWRGLIAAVRSLVSQTRDEITIECIGLTGQMHGTVLLDAALRPIGNAIIWSDSRSAADAEALMRNSGESIVETAGSAIAAGFQAATIHWLRRTQPDRWRQVQRLLLPKDYLRLHLTGVLATDPSDAAGTLLADRQTRAWSPELLALAGIDAERLPVIQPSVEVTGTLSEFAANDLGLPAGIPVISGAADAAAAALGAGVIAEDQLLITLSTGAQVLTPQASPRFDREGRLHTFASALEPSASSTGWYTMGATTTAGLALRWLRSGMLHGTGYDELNRLASTAPLGSNRLLFLPHMTGERSPELNPHARGAFIGLTPAHDRADLARAVFEGVAFSIFDAYQPLAAMIDTTPGEIVLAGGGARSPLWQQILADLFGLPVKPLDSAEQTVIAAAALAAATNETSPASLAQRWARYLPAIEPSPERTQRYRELYDIYRTANRGLTATYESLARLGESS